MADNKSTVSSSGIGFAGLLTVAFIVLKLCGIITWSWWWVISPVWISVSLVIILLTALGILGAWGSKW